MASVSVPFTSQGGGRTAPRRRVAIITLGCKVNAFESALIGQSLEGHRWERVAARERADVYVVNTCTVTREADRQARQEVRRAVRRNPDAFVVVTGCYAQMSPEACAAIPGVDLVVGNDRKLELAELLSSNAAPRLTPAVMVGDLNEHVSLPDQLLTGFDGRTRAYVQIQQGCDQGCTFCVIHRARGPSRSLPPAMVREQVAQLVASGCGEVVVCGVDLGSYGDDLGAGYGLVELLADLSGLSGEYRLRLSSIDPLHISDGLIELMAAERRLCPHLHLSLQSGNTLILKRMKRRYGRRLLYERVGALRRAVPGLVLSADVMAGFPTESELHFQDTVAALWDLEVAYPHVFPYSERPGTPAARIPKQVPVAVRKARARRLRVVGRSIRDGVMRQRFGRRLRVLVEGGGQPPPGLQLARAAEYLPVLVRGSAHDAGRWIDVHVIGRRGDALIARVAA